MSWHIICGATRCTFRVLTLSQVSWPPFFTRIRVYNMAGEVVLNADGPASGGNYCRQVPDKLAPGIYLYAITDNNKGKVTGKLAITR